MIGHYFSIAFRNFARRPGSTLGKVIALSLGLGCFVGAYTVTDYFASFDSHWANAGRIFAIREDFRTPGASIGFPNNLYVGPPVAKYLRADFPKLQTVARFLQYNRVAARAGDKTSMRAVDGADADFLKIFDLPFLAGDRIAGLSNPKSAIITAKAAEAMFGTSDVLGRTVRLGKIVDVTITGVIAEIPPPSNFGKALLSDPFDLLVSMDVVDDLFARDMGPAAAKMPRFSEMDSWGSTLFQTYVLLPKDGAFTRADLDRGLKGFGDRHIPKTLGTATFSTAALNKFAESMIDGVYLGGRFGISFTTILYLLGVLVLGVACLDFANLATAEASSRAKEIGMRKTMGATRRQICGQTMVEVGILTAISLVIAVIAVSIAISTFNHPANIGMHIPGLDRIDFWAGIVALLAVVTLAAGGYPALVLAHIRPIFALRMGTVRGGSRLLRAILTGSQFAATSFLVVAVAVIYIQNAKMKATGLGRTSDPNFDVETNLRSAGIDPDTFRSEIVALPGVKAYTAASIPPYDVISVGAAVYATSPDPMAKRIEVNPHSVSYDFFKTVGIKVLAGREFARALDDVPVEPTQSDQPIASKGAPPPSHILLDKSTAAAFGWTPAQAVGKTLYARNNSISTGKDMAQLTPEIIVGVVGDAAFQLTAVGPRYFSYLLDPKPNFPIIQISKSDIQGTVKRIQDVWATLAPDTPLRYRFMDDAFNRFFRMYATLSRAAAGLALFAIAISTLGLIGMATYMVGRRIREIGVRKTLGASTLQILKMILWDLSKPVLVANVIAWPAAYLAAETYLDLFVTRTPVTPLPFIASLVVTLVVAWGAVGLQTFRAASVKPAAVLRYE